MSICSWRKHTGWDFLKEALCCLNFVVLPSVHPFFFLFLQAPSVVSCELVVKDIVSGFWCIFIVNLFKNQHKYLWLDQFCSKPTRVFFFLFRTAIFVFVLSCSSFIFLMSHYGYVFFVYVCVCVVLLFFCSFPLKFCYHFICLIDIFQVYIVISYISLLTLSCLSDVHA